MTNTQKTLPLEHTKWLEAEIQEAVIHWRQEHNGEDYWRNPLAGIVSAHDPLVGKLPLIVDPEHADPSDLLPGAQSVIVYFLPFQITIGQENARSGFYAARSWAESYVATNQLIAHINMHLKACLEQAGHQGLVTPATHNFDEKKLVSRWSHKHLAYIAGLGTFGHHQLLITSAGCCGRLGSLITTMVLPPSCRPQVEWCLLKAGQRCLACVSKCSYDALLESRFDRHACYRQCLRNDAHHKDLPLVDVCGKCSCDVPCSYQIPQNLRK